MASYSSRLRKIRPARSLSLPLESNPILSRISKELIKLQSIEQSSSSSSLSSMSESISNGLSGISDLYGCVGEFLCLPLTQQSLTLRQNDALLTELVHGSSRLLQVCCGASEIASQLKTEASGKFPDDYFRARKGGIKSARKLLASLKGIERDVFGSWDDLAASDVSVVIRVLRCVSVIAVSVLESLVSFLGVSKKKIPLISKLMRKKGRLREGEDSKGIRNELEEADVALSALSSGDVDGELARRRLEDGMEGILNGLESLLSQLTKTRASLFEIFTF